RRGSGDFHTNYASALGLPNPLKAFNWPSISDLDLGAYPFGSQAPFWLLTNYGLIQDNATKIKGKHEFQFGFHVKHEIVDKSADSNAGPFSASTLATALYDLSSTPASPLARPQTGFGLANLELGVLNYSAMFRRPWSHIRRQEYSPYDAAAGVDPRAVGLGTSRRGVPKYREQYGPLAGWSAELWPPLRS